MKTLLLCPDGATFDVLERFEEKEGFEGLNSAINDGVKGELFSYIPQTSPAGPSIYTGLNPAKMGAFGFSTGTANIVNSTRIEGKRLWNYLSENGIKNSFLYFPTTYPPEDTKGLFASGKLTPSEDSDYVRPEKFKEELEFHKKENESFPDKIQIRFDNLEKAIEEFDSQVAGMWIDETDGLQHHHWTDHQAIENGFKSFSSGLERMKEKFDNILIFSDHGFGPREEKNFYINTWLKEKGWLETTGSERTQTLKNFLYKTGKQLLPEFIKKFLRKHAMKDAEESAGATIPGVDWENTKAFFDKGWSINIVKDNLEEGYEEFREELIEKLRNLKINGNKVFKHVWKREEIFEGPHIDQAGDIFFIHTDEFYTDRRIKSNLWDRDAIGKRAKLEGNHRSKPEAVLIAYGKSFKEGKTIKGADIYDLVPTVLALYGISLGPELDGRPLKEMFKEDVEVERGEGLEV